ncbi:hypothetical protein ACXR2W_03660 [Leucobacter sp. HY1908]
MYEASVIVRAGENMESLRAAVRAVLQTPWARRMEIVVVAEENAVAQARLLCAVECAPHVIRVVPNKFQPGRAGARRTGILASTASVIAFYDDSDGWARSRQRAAVAHNA